MAATRPDDATQRHPDGTPLILLGALSALGFASALSLVRVFEGRVWLYGAFGAVVLPHALGWVVNRRRVGGLPALLVWMSAGWMYTVIAVEPRLTARGIPTPAAIRAWTDALLDAPEILKSSTTPVVPVEGALLLALIVIWSSNAAAHWSATRLDGTLGAVVPTLALFVALNALGDGPYAFTSALYAGAIAVFLMVQHHLALSERRSWFHARPQRRSRLLVGGAATIVAIAIVAAIVGPSLPTAQSAGLIDYQEWGEGRGGSGSVQIVSPLVSIGDQLNNPDATEVFTVLSPTATYWRLVALDNYDGDVWGLQDTTARAGFADPQGGTTERIVQRFEMGPLGGPFLPAAFQVVDTQFLSDELSIHESATLFQELPDGGSYDGLRYDVISELPYPSETDLAGIRPVDPDDFDDLLALPDDFPERVRELAFDVTANARTPFEQAIALQDWFRDPDLFTYDTEIEGHDEDALAKFVLEERRGFCEQFAGSYAAMARAIGLPARVAVGFTPGELGTDGRYHVTTKNAHAWPEIYFDGLGWIRFEPTPGRFEPTPTDFNGDGDDPNPGNGGPGASASTTTTIGGPTTTRDPSATTRPRPSFPIDAGPSGSGDSTDPSGSTDVLRRVGAVVASIALVGGMLFGAIGLGGIIRRRRRSHAATARDRIIGAWAQAMERLAEVGIHRRPAATPVEFAMREAPAAGIGSAGPALLALSHLHTDALFSLESPDDEAADAAWSHVASIEESIVRSTRRTARWRRRLTRHEP
jgi:transglutaminase-like putative cysteine protease